MIIYKKEHNTTLTIHLFIFITKYHITIIINLCFHKKVYEYFHLESYTQRGYKTQYGEVMPFSIMSCHVTSYIFSYIYASGNK